MKDQRLKLSGNKPITNKTPKARSEYAGTRIRVTQYDAAKHLVKVVDSETNQPLARDLEVIEPVSQKQAFTKPNSKVIKTLDAPGAPILEVNDYYSSIRGNADYGFFSYREGGGNIIKGPLSIATEPHQIRLGGLTTLNPLVTSGFPSTIVTPIPMTVWNLPGAGAIQPLLKDVTIMATLVAAMGTVS